MQDPGLTPGWSECISQAPNHHTFEQKCGMPEGVHSIGHREGHPRDMCGPLKEQQVVSVASAETYGNQ